jgi:hypothetical protein
MMCPEDARTPEAPILSVVVVIGRQRGRAMDAVERLLRQDPAEGIEVVVVDAAPDEGGLPWLAHARVRYVKAGGLASVAAGKATGAGHAAGRAIAFCEDHCHVEAGWAEAVVDGFERGADAVAYAFGNLNPVSYVSRAFLVLAYGPWMSPVASGWIPSPSWMNVAYRADLLREYADRLPDLLHCETLFHVYLRRRGARFWQAGKAHVLHLNHPRLPGACADSAVWQRLFASTRARVECWSLARRLCYAVASPVLSAPVIALRLGRRVWSRPELRVGFIVSLPVILAVYYYGAIHEARGYLCGEGRSGIRSLEVETSDPRS